MIYTRGEGANKGWPYEMDDDVIYTRGEGANKGGLTRWMTT